MNLDKSLLRLVTLIYGFTNHPTKVKWLINLLITLGTEDNVVTKEVEFLIIDQPSTYNAFIDRSLMKKIKMVTVLY